MEAALTIEILNLGVGVAGLLCVIKLIFVIGRLYERFEAMSKRLETVETRFEELACVAPRPLGGRIPCAD